MKYLLNLVLSLSLVMIQVPVVHADPPTSKQVAASVEMFGSTQVMGTYISALFQAATAMVESAGGRVAVLNNPLGHPSQIVMQFPNLVEPIKIELHSRLSRIGTPIYTDIQIGEYIHNIEDRLNAEFFHLRQVEKSTGSLNTEIAQRSIGDSIESFATELDKGFRKSHQEKIDNLRRQLKSADAIYSSGSRRMQEMRAPLELLLSKTFSFAMSSMIIASASIATYMNAKYAMNLDMTLVGSVTIGSFAALLLIRSIAAGKVKEMKTEISRRVLGADFNYEKAEAEVRRIVTDKGYFMTETRQLEQVAKNFSPAAKRRFADTISAVNVQANAIRMSLFPIFANPEIYRISESRNAYGLVDEIRIQHKRTANAGIGMDLRLTFIYRGTNRGNVFLDTVHMFNGRNSISHIGFADLMPEVAKQNLKGSEILSRNLRAIVGMADMKGFNHEHRQIFLRQAVDATASELNRENSKLAENFLESSKRLADFAEAGIRAARVKQSDVVVSKTAFYGVLGLGIAAISGAMFTLDVFHAPADKMDLSLIIPLTTFAGAVGMFAMLANSVSKFFKFEGFLRTYENMQSELAQKTKIRMCRGMFGG